MPAETGKHWVYNEQSLKDDKTKLVSRIENITPFHDGFGEMTEALRQPVGQLVGEEAILFKEKINFKMPGGDGSKPHQDSQAGWDDYADFFISALVSIDEATPENGCLQVLRGSHLMGRVDHTTVGEQTGADPERVEEALKQLELVYCELEPGSAVIFHSNLLHRSDQNKSEHPRWAFICCYNAARNNPYRQVRHPQYTPLEKLLDADLVTIGKQQFQLMQ